MPTPPPAQAARRRVSVVPHTHWDREWYASYQAFRLRLVDTLDAFLPHLEADPSYTRFLLDGQMAVVDDYLEVRPEAKGALRRLARSGRLDMGPWYTLMDEFLVSGETIVRDLQLGFERAQEFGGAMNVGYLPDMFGHVAQMPQLLALAGIHHAVVWRGVPAAVQRSAFWWEAPDGSRVRAEYLLEGYGNGEGIADDAKALVARIGQFVDEHDRLLAPGEPILWMNGTDHQAPQAWLGRVVAEANGIQSDYELAVTSLAEHLAGAPTDGLPTWRGELRSGARANLLMGVASNRVDVKQAAARAERSLERLAEPLAALFLPPSSWPETLLRVAWREVIRNAAHDSICACSVDEVCDAVLHRYAEARTIADGLADRALDALAASMTEEGWVVVNPAARARSGVVEFDVPGVGPMPGAQILLERDAVVADQRLSLEEARPILTNLRSQQLGARTFVNAIEVEADGDEVSLTLRVAPRLLTNLLLAEEMASVLARLEAQPSSTLHLQILREPYRRILVRAPDVPGFGWAMVGEPSTGSHPVEALGETGLTNGLVHVEVDTTDGTFAVDGVAGFDRLVDGGDLGDTYNYSPPPVDHEVDGPDAVRVEVEERGPVRGRIRVNRTFTWPERVADGARTGTRSVEVTTLVELHAGEPLVRVTTSFTNPSRDHRLRTWLPLPEPASTSRAECAFAVVERGLDAEGGPTERGLPTFPSRRFVQAGGLTVVHEGLLEYELVDVRDGAAHALALTLVRSTGMLSRVEMSYRPLPAGPPITMEGPQMLGPVEVRYAICVDPHADAFALVDDAFVPLAVRTSPGRGSRPASGCALEVRGAEVSALRRVAGGLEVRVYNPSPQASTLSISGRTGWTVDLRGAPVTPFDGAATLGPWEIRTLVLSGGE